MRRELKRVTYDYSDSEYKRSRGRGWGGTLGKLFLAKV